jgi:hypothetical protein
MAGRKETSRIEIMKLLAFFLLQWLYQKLDNKSYFCRREILETPIFLELLSERMFHLLLKFLHIVDNESYDEATCSSQTLYKLNPMLDHLNAKFTSVYAPECDVSVDEWWCGRDVCCGRNTLLQNVRELVWNHLNCVKPNLVMCGILLFTPGRTPYRINSICHLSCSNVSGGTLVLVMLS